VSIEIFLNGEVRSVATGTSLLHLIGSLSLDPERVAIELDRRIVKRQEWDTTVVTAGARIEVVQFVGGG